MLDDGYGLPQSPLLLEPWVNKAYACFQQAYSCLGQAVRRTPEGQPGGNLWWDVLGYRERPLPHQEPQGLLVALRAGPQTRRARGGEREDQRARTPVGLLHVDGPQQPHRIGLDVVAAQFAPLLKLGSPTAKPAYLLVR